MDSSLCLSYDKATGSQAAFSLQLDCHCDAVGVQTSLLQPSASTKCDDLDWSFVAGAA